MKTQEELHVRYLKNRQWFLNRIGKRIWRTDTHCCDVCQKIYNEGIIVKDEQHAIYLNDVAGECGIKYFDTKEEVMEYEKTEEWSLRQW